MTYIRHIFDVFISYIFHILMIFLNPENSIHNELYNKGVGGFQPGVAGKAMAVDREFNNKFCLKSG